MMIKKQTSKQVKKKSTELSRKVSTKLPAKSSVKSSEKKSTKSLVKKSPSKAVNKSLNSSKKKSTLTSNSFSSKKSASLLQTKKDTVTFEINGLVVTGRPEEKIIDVAKRYAIDIPHLCMHPRLERIGACRLCLVEIEGMKKPVTSCTQPIAQGMKVKTHTPRVLDDRRKALQLILANHDYNCVTCTQNLQCKLQSYAESFGIIDIPFVGIKRQSTIDRSSPSIVRDNSKCILCQRCIRICNNVQTVNAIGLQNRGFYSKVTPPLDLNMEQSNCVNCGQCVIVCPTGALSEKKDIDPIVKLLQKKDKHLVVQTAPSIRAALGELFDMPDGTPVTGKMVAALRQLGFDKVFDTDLAADITIIEEATEFVKRYKRKENLPMITTCCPAWIKFAEQFFFEQMHHMSTCRSPQAMMASLIKTWYAKKNKLKPEDIVLVDIMPCTAKKFEIARPEFAGEADFVITTVELAKLIKQFNIDFVNLPDAEFDKPLGESSGAGDIFGRTGGVMEAALRTAADMITGKNNTSVEYVQTRGLELRKEFKLTIGKEVINIVVVHTLGEARKIMNEIREGKSPYHFVEIMACYGGCVGGGGQPRYDDPEILVKRASALNKVDTKKKTRKSHKNATVMKLYKEYIGAPGGKRAHELLHTSYVKREFL